MRSLVFQEYRAEKAAAALARLTTPHCRVIRDGHSLVVTTTEVVPGDLLLLEAGDLVAADARLIQASVFRVNEAPLTGNRKPWLNLPLVWYWTRRWLSGAIWFFSGPV